LREEVVAGLLESSEPVEDNKFQGILPPNIKLNRIERKFAGQFTRLLRSLWAYSFMIIKVLLLRIFSCLLITFRKENGR